MLGDDSDNHQISTRWPAFICILTDLAFVMQTFLERGSSLLRLQGGDRYSINSGDTIRFGNVRCQVDVTQV